MVKYYKATTVSEVGSHENCASEDPTFVHPDKQNQGEREWLMKHNGGNAKENRREKPVGNCYRGRDWVMCGFLKSSGIPPHGSGCFMLFLYEVHWSSNDWSLRWQAPVPRGAPRAAGWVWMDQGAGCHGFFPARSRTMGSLKVKMPKMELWYVFLVFKNHFMDLLTICGSRTMENSRVSHENTWKQLRISH